MENRHRNTTLLAATIALAAVSASAQPSNNASPVGTNLWFFRDWVSEYSMVDAFKASRPWVPHCMDCRPVVWDTGESKQIELDERGWVKSLPSPVSGARFTSVGTLMFTAIDGHYPAGQYVVLYEGEGTLNYGRDAVKREDLSSPGRDVLDVTPSAGGIWLTITSTDPAKTGNYLRNIRVIMPGFEESYREQIFHPDLLEKLKPYRAIRYMQWAETNGSTQSSWNTRTLPDDARWNIPGGAGVPVEILVVLSNRLSADPWICMPHMAGDDYMASYAALVRDTLAPDLRVYVEFSNEVWNGSSGFNQSGYVQRQGMEKWQNPSISPFTKQINWHGMRTAQMCDIWKSVWGEQSGRVLCVMGAQSGNPWTASQSLDCPLWSEGAPCYKHGIDIVAGGPYFGGYLGDPRFEEQVLAWTKDEDQGLAKLFEELLTGGVLSGGPPGGAMARAFQEMDDLTMIAADRGLGAAAYEGGSHFASLRSNATVTDLFRAASLDPRMGGVYDRYFAAWRDRGGQIFMHYFNVGNTTRLGSFGALEYMDQSSSPKYDAILRFIGENPCWWANCALPAPAAP
ncbi:MAG: cellulose-binding protein [Acidobacteria bacterium]|nr:cellulose-binding protein [Acidobacteriota bacterium]